MFRSSMRVMLPRSFVVSPQTLKMKIAANAESCRNAFVPDAREPASIFHFTTSQGRIHHVLCLARLHKRRCRLT